MRKMAEALSDESTLLHQRVMDLLGDDEFALAVVMRLAEALEDICQCCWDGPSGCWCMVDD